MIVISASKFRANQTKYFDMADKGEDVVLKSRKYGYFRLVPVREEDTGVSKRYLIEELREPLQEVNDDIQGKTAKELPDG